MRKQGLLLALYLIAGFLVSIPLTGSSCDDNKKNEDAEIAQSEAIINATNASRAAQEAANAAAQAKSNQGSPHY